MKMTPARIRWIVRLGSPLVAAIGATWRIRVYGHQADHAAPDLLFSFLHGDMLLPAILYRKVPCAVVISQHGDGEIIAQVLRRLGDHIPVRGSSTRGGARAFLEMVRGNANLPWGISPDGPRGPRGSVHDGVIQLASESGRTIMPLGYAVSAGKYMRSWDRFVIPYPFARVASYIAEPLSVPPALDRPQRKAFATELEARLRQAHEEAVAALATW